MKRYAPVLICVFIVALGSLSFSLGDYKIAGSSNVFKANGDGSALNPIVPIISMTGSLSAVTLTSSEAHIGEVGGAGVVLNLNPTLDTTTYADGDTLFQVSQLSSAARISGGRCYLQSVLALDEDDQGQAFDLVFLNLSTTLGATNAAVAITDTNARSIVGRVSVGSSDFYDMGGSRVASIHNIGLMMSTTGTSSLWVGGVSRGTGTYTAGGLRLSFKFMQD